MSNIDGYRIRRESPRGQGTEADMGGYNIVAVCFR